MLSTLASSIAATGLARQHAAGASKQREEQVYHHHHHHQQQQQQQQQQRPQYVLTDPKALSALAALVNEWGEQEGQQALMQMLGEDAVWELLDDSVTSLDLSAWLRFYTSYGEEPSNSSSSSTPANRISWASMSTEARMAVQRAALRVLVTGGEGGEEQEGHGDT
jgi:hypothetical protein